MSHPGQMYPKDNLRPYGTITIEGAYREIERRGGKVQRDDGTKGVTSGDPPRRTVCIGWYDKGNGTSVSVYNTGACSLYTRKASGFFSESFSNPGWEFPIIEDYEL